VEALTQAEIMDAWGSYSRVACYGTFLGGDPLETVLAMTCTVYALKGEGVLIVL